MRAPVGDKPLLKHLAFTVVPGEVLGVIGPSGAGKTTLARILAGGMSPDVGKVRLDGADYAAWDPERLARHIGYLPQDSILFAGTIKENISASRARSPKARRASTPRRWRRPRPPACTK